MDRPRLIRGVRIAVSAVGGIFCVLLIVIWVRSYWWADTPHLLIGQTWYQEETLRGCIILSREQADAKRLKYGTGFHTVRAQDHVMLDETGKSIEPFFGFLYQTFPTGSVFVIIPMWFPILISAALAAAPWIHWSNRFSLRTLLIATTLIAVLLATAAYLRLW